MNLYAPLRGVFLNLSLALILSGCGAAFMGGGNGYALSPMGMTPMGMGMGGMGGYGMGMGGYGMGMTNPGTEYGTGGMELGTNLGGWGDGIGTRQGQSPGITALDDDPHGLSSTNYENPAFKNPRDTPQFYHPSNNQTAGP
jgi:hypothetical protein